MAKNNTSDELIIANIELAFQKEEKKKRAAELIIADKELAFQNKEKEKRAAELIIANKELVFQNREKEKRADELIIANKKLAFQNKEKEKRADELIIANKELVFQNKEKEKRAAELIIANNELAFQNEEKEKRAAELIVANKELAFQNVEKEKRASELIIANKELAFQNEEKEKRAAELILAKERAEESDRLRSAFLNNLSHEIRTPMNGILGFVELLKGSNFTGDDQKEYLKIFEESGNRMLNIIENIIRISKIASKQPELNISKTNINEQIKEIHSLFKTEVEQKGMEISFRNSLSERRSIIFTDHKKINTIITNLLQNAIKFTEKGHIDFGYVKKREFLEFFVKDTGIGISKEHQKVIFERFRQVNESLSRNYEGAGLGLSISKAYVEMLGGKIWVKSGSKSVNGVKGSEFYFTIPYTTKLELTLS